MSVLKQKLRKIGVGKTKIDEREENQVEEEILITCTNCHMTGHHIRHCPTVECLLCERQKAEYKKIHGKKQEEFYQKDHAPYDCELALSISDAQDPLSRSWVLYELLISILYGSNIDIAMTAAEKHAFLDILRQV